MTERPHLRGLNRLDGKRAVVTGANSGIGRQIADNLAALGAEVVLATRSRERGERAVSELRSSNPSAKLKLMALDQSSQASVAAFAREFADRFGALDLLVNNAGIYPSSRVESVDGIEMTFATNVMGYFQLTSALAAPLEAAAPAPARVLFVASKLAGGLELDDLQYQRRKFGGIRAYKQSKQANRMLAREFARRFSERGIKVATVHPGGVRTSIGRHQRGAWGALVRLAFRTQKPVTDGADTATWLASLDEDDFVSGRYWAYRAERACEFCDDEQERALWKRCEALLKVSR